MAGQLPPMHQLILSAGVMRPTRTCSCCMCRPLYEVSTVATLDEPAGRDVFYVCAACDVDDAHRQK